MTSMYRYMEIEFAILLLFTHDWISVLPYNKKSPRTRFQLYLTVKIGKKKDGLSICAF